MKRDNKSGTVNFRQKAEELLEKKLLKTGLQHPKTRTQKLIRELEVRQIELELLYGELKLAEEEQPESSEERYRLLYENAKIGLYRTTPEGTILLANKALATMLGYQSFDELAQRNLNEDGFEMPSQRKEFLEKIEQNVEVDNFKSTWIRQDRTPVFVRESAQAIRDTSGKTLYYDGTVEDITERKLAMEALLVSQERLREFNVLQGLLLTPNHIEQKLKLITDTVVRIMGADFARIWMIKPGDRCEAGCIHAQVTEGPHTCRFREKCLHLMASSGSYTQINGQVHARVPFGCYKIGKIAAAEETKFLTNNVTTDPRVHNNEWAKELGLVSFAGYRLVDTNGTPLGVLALFSKKAISGEDDSFLEGIAHSTSRVLHSARVEEALRESEARYFLLFEKSADGILIADIDTKIFKYANPILCQMLGYTEEELKTMGLADIHPRQDLPRIIAEFESQARGEKILAPDIPCLRKDGSILYADINTSTMTMDGRACAVGLFRDITARKQAEETLKSSLERSHRQQAVVTAVAVSHQLAAGDVQELAHQLNEHGAKAVDVERVSVWLFNNGGNELECIDLYEHSTDRHSAGAVLLKNEYKNEFEALQTAKYIDANDPLTDPRTVGYVERYLKPLRITSMLDTVIREGNRNIGVLCFEHVGKKHNWEPDEITFASQLADQIAIAVLNRERILAEGLLKSSEEQYRTLFENVPVGIGVTDLTGKLIAFNDAMLKPGGYSRDDIIGIGNVANLYYNLSDRESVISLMKEKGSVNQYPIKFKRKDGSSYDTLLSLSIIHVKDQPRIQALVEDITERKRAEAALQKAHENLKRTLRFEEALLSAIPTPVFYKDKEGRYLGCNRAFTEFMGVPPEEIKGKTAGELWPSQNGKVNHAHDFELMRNPIPQIYEHKVRDKDGLEHPVIYSKDVFRDDNDQVAGIVGAFLDITKRKQAEEALRRERTLLRLLIDNVPDLMYTKDTACRKTLVNIADVQNMGVKSESEVLGKDDFAFFPKEMAEEFYADDQFVIQTGQPLINKEEYTLNESGQKKWLLTSKFPLRGQSGQIIGLAGIGRDITERKKAEEELQKSEVKFRTLFESANDAIFLMKEDTFVDCNFKTEQMFQCSREEILNRHPYEFSPPFQPDGRDSKERALEKINAALSGAPQSFEWKHRRLDGTPFDAAVSLNRIYIDGKVTVQAIVRDISEHKQAEEELRESEERFRRLFELSPDAIMLIDPSDTNVDWPIVDCNETACKMNGYTREELIGKSIDIVNTTSGTREERAEYLENLRHVHVVHLETIHRHRDGHIFPIDVSTSIETFLGRELVLGIDRDITERKLAEEEIRLKNEQLLKLNAEKDKFFSIISHDLRSPFNSFLGLTQIMAEELTYLTMSQLQEIAESMSNSAINLCRLLENLLQWSRMQQGSVSFNPELLQLHQIVDECTTIVTEQAKNKGIGITIDIPDDLKVLADSNMLQTIIRNLVSNAVKFTPKVGKICVSAKATANKSVEISVSDTGIGMTSEMVSNLFRLDVQSNRKGTEGEPSTGLGLLLCKEFVEKHGGKFWVESEEGKGSTFYFTIPNIESNE